MVLGRQGPLAKGLTGGIGLFQEYKAERDARKHSQPTLEHSKGDDSNSQMPASTSDTESEDDESWAQDLDATQAVYAAEISEDGDRPADTVDDIVRHFVTSQPLLAYRMNSKDSLPQPVILPQRRPGMRSRGWIRAYAPTLAARDISSSAWLEFLTGFEKAIGKNRWFHVLNFAVWVADKIRLALQGISLIARVVSAAIHLSLETARRGYIHSKQNKYLDKMNEEYFKPRGLYAMVIKYKPKKSSSTSFPSSSDQDTHSPIETVDITTNIAEVIEKRDAEAGKFWKGVMKAAASKTTKEEEIPDFAPLIFPYLDYLSEIEKQSAIKQSGAFLSDYYDRRAQATFSMDHPESKLADVAPRKEFASAYADPANPKSTAPLIETVSGGYLQSPSTMLTKRRKQKRSRLGIGDVGGGGILEQRQARRSTKKSSRPIKKLLRQDALYLMVVDLPSQAEQDAVVKAIEALADGHEG